MISEFDQVREIRRRLGDVWAPFFARFGGLTPIQIEALPILLDGHNAVVCSPTATGKTEAALAPAALKLMKDRDSEGPALLYIAPTRALIGDLQKRFADVLAELEITSAFRTSDAPYLPSRFPHALFTTPESLDSLLCRRKGIWNRVRFLVLDELHLLHGVARGDQLAVLLNRLRLDCWKSPPQQVILSATVADPPSMAERYIGDAVVAGRGRARIIRFQVQRTLEEALTTCRSARRFKVLAFCNSRAECENLAEETARRRLWPADGIFVHHASLTAARRRQLETDFRAATAAVCFATMTLELGVDIGDVSAAILVRPPPDAASFVQRLGRACRRESEIFGLGIAYSPEDEESFELYRDMALNEELDPIVHRPDLSVAVQQTFSLLFANPAGIDIQQLSSYLAPVADTETVGQLLDHLVLTEWLRRHANRILPSQRVLDLAEKGEVHTNIADSRPKEVVDARTGLSIGQLTGPAENGVVLGGRRWRIVQTKGKRVFVEPGGPADSRALFGRRSGHGRFFHLLPKSLQERMELPVDAPSD
jgi:ATP-dependent Lhr-like helicase